MGSAIVLDGAEAAARPGDVVRLPMGQPHGIFNRSDATATCLFAVAPTRKLFDLFAAIHGLKEQTPEAVVALAAQHEVEFLPPMMSSARAASRPTRRPRGSIVPCSVVFFASPGEEGLRWRPG